MIDIDPQQLGLHGTEQLRIVRPVILRSLTGVRKPSKWFGGRPRAAQSGTAEKRRADANGRNYTTRAGQILVHVVPPSEVAVFVRARPARSDAGVSGASSVIANCLPSVVATTSPGPERRITAERPGMTR